MGTSKTARALSSRASRSFPRLRLSFGTCIVVYSCHSGTYNAAPCFFLRTVLPVYFRLFPPLSVSFRFLPSLSFSCAYSASCASCARPVPTCASAITDRGTSALALALLNAEDRLSYAGKELHADGALRTPLCHLRYEYDLFRKVLLRRGRFVSGIRLRRGQLGDR